MNIDWARINEMPQWYLVRPENEYSVTIGDQPPRSLSGQELIDGLAVDVVPCKPLKVHVQRIRE
jgi:hypothetical protein